MCQGNNICNNALASIFAESADLQQHNFNLSKNEVIYFGHWALGTLGNWLFGLFYYYALVWRENSNNLTKTSKKYLQKTTLAHWEVYLVRRELDLTVADGILGEIRRTPNYDL